MSKINKYKEYWVKWFIKDSSYIQTEVFRDGKKLPLILPSVPVIYIGTKTDYTYPHRSIFIYNSDSENEAEKEICVSYSVLRDQTGQYNRSTTLSCYNHRSYTISRGPMTIKKGEVVLKMFQQKGSAKFCVFLK